jgi:hypothetical protein
VDLIQVLRQVSEPLAAHGPQIHLQNSDSQIRMAWQRWTSCWQHAEAVGESEDAVRGNNAGQLGMTTTGTSDTRRSGNTGNHGDCTY